MAINSDEENIEHSESIQPDNTPEDIIPINEPEPINPTLASTNMEVHHHAYHGHEKKTWKNYFWEFFMLFLAVFCGFLAEYQLEHLIENQREKQYIKGVVQNLKDDTAQLHRAIPFLERRVQILDSIVKMSKEDLTETQSLKTITRLAMKAAKLTTFNSNTAAIAQLKAGNLRLIRRNHAADSIMRYDIINELTKTQWNVFYSFFSTYIQQYEDVFDITILMDSSYKNGISFNTPPPPVSTDKEKLRVYFNRAVAYFITYRDYMFQLNYQLEYAERLADYLKKEYHLEND